MVQTDLKSDDFCGLNTAAAPFYWIMDTVQVKEQYTVGEVGVPTGVGLHTPAEVIGVSNFLSDRGNYLSDCMPPAPSMISSNGFESDASILGEGNTLEIQGMGGTGPISDRDNSLQKQQMEHLYMENRENFKNEVNKNNDTNYSNLIDKADGQKVPFKKHEKLTFLLPEVTQQKGAAKNLSAIDLQGGFSGNSGNLFTNPQNLTHVIERMWLERGGLDQNQIIKQSQEPFTKNTHGDFLKNNHHSTGPKNLKNDEQQPTCNKIKQPYSTKYPFGIPPISEQRYDEKSKHFNAIDVVSLGISSPAFDQNINLPFNYNAKFSNGGCNKVSFLQEKYPKMCSDDNNDLTGINAYDFGTDMSPPGLYPISSQ
jgi:hypothetical protein